MKLFIGTIINDYTSEETQTSTVARNEKEAEENVTRKLDKLERKTNYEQTYSIVDFYVVASRVDRYKITLTKI